MKMFKEERDDYRPMRRENSVPVCLIADGEEASVTLLDISRDGAKVQVPFAILPGTAVALRINAAEVTALVQWCDIPNAGLRFLERLERDVLIALEGRESDENDIFG